MALPKNFLQRIEALERIEQASLHPQPLYDVNFPEQRAFIEEDEPGQLLLLLCTRRAGKSWGGGSRLIRTAQKHPGCSVLFVGLTRESAAGILWKDVLKVINEKHNLGATFNETKLQMRLPNGSVIYLMGADADEAERQKMLGRKYAEVVIDEAASYSIDLRHLVYSILKPGVADYRGTVCLIGTPSNLKTGLYYELSHDQDPRKPGRWERNGWKCFRWTALENPHMREKWLAEIADLLKGNPLLAETPGFQQMYYGIWVVDADALVYKYKEGRNDYLRLPAHLSPDGWHRVLAVDLGYNDPCSFTVMAYHDECRTLFIERSYKKGQLDITDTAKEMDRIKAAYEIEVTVIDGANKQAVAELNNRHGMNALPADKRDKPEFIDMMNDDLILGNVQVLPSACVELVEEWAALVWDERALVKRKRQEHPSCHNHCADGAYYGWRWCYQYLSVLPETPRPSRGTPEAVALAVVEQQQEQEEYWESQFARKQSEREEGWV